MKRILVSLIIFCGLIYLFQVQQRANALEGNIDIASGVATSCQPSSVTVKLILEPEKMTTEIHQRYQDIYVQWEVMSRRGSAQQTVIAGPTWSPLLGTSGCMPFASPPSCPRVETNASGAPQPNLPVSQTFSVRGVIHWKYCLPGFFYGWNCSENQIKSFDLPVTCTIQPQACGQEFFQANSCNVAANCCGSAGLCPENQKCTATGCQQVAGYCGVAEPPLPPSPPSVPPACGNPGTSGACGATSVNCPVGWRCLPPSNCVKMTDSCTGDTICAGSLANPDPNHDTVGDCGSPGGCPYGSMCMSDGTCDSNQPLCSPLPPPTGCSNNGTPGACGVTGGCTEGFKCVPGASPRCQYDANCSVSSCGIAPGFSCVDGGTCCYGLPCTGGYCGGFIASGITWPVPPIPQYTGPIVDFQKLLTAIYTLLLPIAIGVFGIPLIAINGYKIMTSQGDPSAVKDGKEGLTSAIIGVLFVLLAMSILRIVLSSFLNVTI